MSAHRIAFLFAGFASALGLGACFIESPQPSTFRFACEADDECGVDQVCAEGLCQQPCGGADDPSCPSDGGAPVCFNGYCSSVCPTDQDVCPDPQTCLSIADPNAEEPPTSGICTVACDEQELPCAEGQVCVMGACLAGCMSDADCGQGESCAFNLCVPG